MKNAQETHELLSAVLGAEEHLLHDEENIAATKTLADKLESSIRICDKNQIPFRKGLLIKAEALVAEIRNQSAEYDEAVSIMSQYQSVADTEKTITALQSLKKRVEEIDTALAPVLDKFGIKLINKGVSPTTTYKNIKLLPKRRYALMANYLWGILSDVMMRETAGIQVGIDFSSEEDAMRKFRVANLMMPFATAMFANSKYRGGVDTGYKSFRALAWLNTDNERCGFATKFQDGMCFKDYVNLLLDTPMIFINRQGHTVNLNGRLTFKQFMEKGHEVFCAKIEDCKLH